MKLFKHRRRKTGPFFGILNGITLALLLFGGFTYAWLYRNEQVYGNIMKMNADPTANMVISDTEEGIAERKVSDGTPYAVSTLIDGDRLYCPCTRKDNGLYYVTNTAAVDKSTGLASSGTLSFAEVGSAEGYYEDYPVYIASCDKSLEGVCLNAEISLDSKPDADTHSYKAASVDFYTDSVSEANYRGTLNLAGVDYSTGAELTSITFDLPDDTVPLNTEGYIKIIMRFYFDGALKETDTQTYVTSDTVSTEQIVIRATFTASDT